MEEELIIPILFFFIAALGGLGLLMFCLRKNEDSMYDWKMVTKYSELMREQTEENLDILSKYSKEKNKLEERIKEKKKKLGMELVDK